jgi:hypothetical protein
LEVVLSEDAAKDIQKTLESSCGEHSDDGKCFQSVRDILGNTPIQLDHTLERRGFGSFLSKIFKKYSLVVLDFAALLVAKWKANAATDHPFKFHVPQDHADKVEHVADATKIVISAGGSAVMTVPNSKPNSVTITG